MTDLLMISEGGFDHNENQENIDDRAACEGREVVTTHLHGRAEGTATSCEGGSIIIMARRETWHSLTKNGDDFYDIDN